MITANVYNLENDTNYQGLSTDEKPRHGVATNSMMLELDTGDVYYALNGSVDQPKVEYLAETTFTASTTIDEGVYRTVIYGVEEPENGITVIFDGVLYDSGGHMNDEEPYFTDYPYFLIFVPAFPPLTEQPFVDIRVGDDNEHTIEIYTEGTPAVWKKVGEPVPRTIFEATISEWEDMDGSYWSDIIPLESEPEHPEHVIIIYDGEEYECTLDDSVEFYYSYGATYDDPMDFSEYPFNFMFDTDDGGSGEWFYQATVSTDTKHTFVIKEV